MSHVDTCDHTGSTSQSEKRFRYDASCTVRCKDNKCETVCFAGGVVAATVGEARIKAEAQDRAQVSREGRTVVGSISITITR